VVAEREIFGFKEAPPCFFWVLHLTDLVLRPKLLSVNRVDLSLQKNFKLTERMNLTLRGDAFNIFNYQFMGPGGVPGLNVNNRNASGLACPISPATPANCPGPSVGVPAPNAFGETWGNAHHLLELPTNVAY